MGSLRTLNHSAGIKFLFFIIVISASLGNKPVIIVIDDDPNVHPLFQNILEQDHDITGRKFFRVYKKGEIVVWVNLIVIGKNALK